MNWQDDSPFPCQAYHCPKREVSTAGPCPVTGCHDPALANTSHLPIFPKPTPHHMFVSGYIFSVTSIRSVVGLGSASGRTAPGTTSSSDSAMSAGLLAADRRQTALSGKQGLPHARTKLTSVSLTFPTINTHRVLVSRIKIHKSKAESMK